MERELYALWQGVVGHERMIRGFKVFCYIDHKNNVFSDAQLDNRRRSKKMSNWALALQQFNIDRVWLRGEANILADAPSRAPWEEKLAQFLPISRRAGQRAGGQDASSARSSGGACELEKTAVDGRSGVGTNGDGAASPRTVS